MSEKKYDWLRFWAPRDAEVKVNGYGALEDPQTEFGHILNPHARTLESLHETHCLGLVGEPGTGKSEEFEQHANSHAINNPGDLISHFHLRDFQTDGKLSSDIFDNNPTVQTWINGNQRLYLYLDSLDEGLLTVRTLATLLVKELRRFPADRLFVRIACRTAEWPESLSAGLSSIWKEDFKVYELLPLRERDIQEAARAENIDATAFFKELGRTSVGPFSVKPITLKFLLQLFREKTSLPHSQRELYATGCRYLCEEFNQSRRDSQRVPDLTTNQLVRIAKRIAAISIFANRSAFWLGPVSADVPDSDIAVADLASGSEGIDSERFQVGEKEIRETLRTGLFTSRGPHRMGWAHQTYAEFLAAEYFVENKTPLSQRIALVTDAVSEGKIVPQLRETAGWLASLDKEIFRHILRADPTTLLRSDVSSAEKADIAALVDRLLESADREEWIDRDWSAHQSYRKLKHLDLAQQLGPYIIDKGKGIFARQIAIDMAEACEIRELQNELVGVVLDQTEDRSLRINAAYAVTRTADSATKEKLRPLALGDAGDDPDDELKGRGIRALWPDHLETNELLPLLTHPKRPSLYGSYKSFLDALAREADDLDLVESLRWLREQQIHADPVSAFRSLRNEILKRSWQQADVPAIAEALADLVVDKVRKLRGDDTERIAIDDDKRRSVLILVLKRLAGTDASWWYMLTHENRLVVPTDVPWLIERVQSEENSVTQNLLAEIISHVLDHRNTDHVGALIEASRKCDVLAHRFGPILNPIYLDSEQADIQRKAYIESQNWKDDSPKAPPLVPSASERVQKTLERFESGETAAWWQLNLQMTLHEDGYCESEHQSDLTKLPGWQANPDIPSRLIEGAERYLIDGDPENHKWTKKNIVYRPAYAGYRALRLLFDQRPEAVLSLTNEVWLKWACILISMPFQSEGSDADVQKRLVELAYERVPDEVSRAISLLIDKENKFDGFLSFLSLLEECWDKRIDKALMQKLKKARLKHNFFIQILSELLQHDFEEAKLYAEALVKRKPSTAAGERRQLTAARLLMTHTQDAGWHILWPRIKKDRVFGRRVVESAVTTVSRRRTTITERLNEVELADLFIWLANEYPYPNDPHYEGVFSPSSDDEARRFRDAVLHQLKERGTSHAVAQLERIIQSLPDLLWLKWTLTDAQETTQRRSWVPLKPCEILKVAHDHDSRIVQNGHHLLEVLIESLQRLQQRLHGETPAVVDLWDEIKPKAFQPITENELSNYVKRHLEDDLKERGIVAGREVEIRPAIGGFKGQNTDIHVDVFSRDQAGDASERITVIIETKGSWNADLDNAMETQLTRRYLRNHGSPFGLYLVGWFSSPQWNAKDTRKRRSERIQFHVAQDRFNKQAASLSANGPTVKTFVLNASLLVPDVS
jgi:hypothetical protein